MGKRSLQESGAGTTAAVRPRAAGLVFVALCVATFWVFAPVRHAEFLNYDDDVYVTENPHIRSGFTWEGVVWAFTDAETNWHPLTWLSHMLDAQLFGLDPAAHHTTALVLHVANAALLLYLLLRLTGDLWPSAFVAALFALHPLRVESVAWVSERKDVLSTLFWLAALLGWVRYTERRTWGRYALVCVLLELSLLSKGMAVTLPILLLLLDYWPLRRWPSEPAVAGRGAAELLREKAILGGIAAVGVAANLIAQRMMGAMATLEKVPLSLRLSNASLSYVHYIRKMFWPLDLAAPYPLSFQPPPLWRPALAVAALAAASVAVVVFGRRRRYLVTGWFWYVVTILPVIGLVQIGSQSMADRYTYVPMIGLFILVAWGAAELVRNHQLPWFAAATAGGLCLVACAGLTRTQLGYWHDSVSLFRRALAVTTDNYLAQTSLGAALMESGRREEARALFEASRRINPSNPWTLSALGGALALSREFAAAEPHLREALRVMPNLVQARINLGVALMGLGNSREAVEHFRLAADREPWNARAHLGLAQALEREGRTAEAQAEFEAALQADPTLRDAHLGWGKALEREGRRLEAVFHYREELRLHPGHAGAERSLQAALAEMGAGDGRAALAPELTAPAAATPEEQNNRGVGLAREGRFAEADEHFREALRLRPEYASARMNLGLSRLKQNDPDGAVEQFRAAARIQPQDAMTHFALAQALEQARRPDEARAEYRRVVELQPDSREAIEALQRLATEEP